MNICLIGGGPTGMRLADELSSKGLNVELYEREKELGGCWKVDWEDGYFREHSPRVMTTNYKNVIKLAKKLGVKTNTVYGNRLYTSYMFLSYFMNNTYSSDFLSILDSITFMSKTDKRTLNEWMIDNDITEEGQMALRKISLSIATNEKEILAYALFSAIGEGQTTNFIQFSENDLWIKKWEEDLVSRPNVKIYKEREITSLQVKANNIVSCKSSGKGIKADTFICAVPLYSLQDILKKSSDKVKDNWQEFDNFKDYCIRSSYSGFGFQLHFSQKIKFKPTWKLNKFTDWSIEVLDIGKYSDNISENFSIQQVLSCVIVDTNSKSTYLDKCPNQIEDPNKVINESIRQLSIAYGFSIIPDKVTISDGLFYNKTKKFWDMKYSAFHPTKDGELNPKGDIENLFSVGPHNIYEVSLLENCFRSADDFVKKYLKDMELKNDSSIDIRTRIIPSDV